MEENSLPLVEEGVTIETDVLGGSNMEDLKMQIEIVQEQQRACPGNCDNLIFVQLTFSMSSD